MTHDYKHALCTIDYEDDDADSPKEITATGTMQYLAKNVYQEVKMLQFAVCLRNATSEQNGY